MTKSKTIVLIHGNFVNNSSWTEWKRHYEQKGYKVYTPANPGHEGNPNELRTNVHPDLVKMGFIDVVKNIDELINSLPEKPLIIGHSMAGMATMKLVEMGKASAGVSIDGAPPKNVFPPFQTLKTVLPSFAIAVHGTDVYIAGNIGYNNATYWKNGIPVSLGKGQANAIFIADK
jgi:pimeloyl-ACP methyl ester carboxylesterase